MTARLCLLLLLAAVVPGKVIAQLAVRVSFLQLPGRVQVGLVHGCPPVMDDRGRLRPAPA